MAPAPTFDHAEARRLYATGEWSQARLAERFGVSSTRIWQIVDPEHERRANAASTRWTREHYHKPCSECGARIRKYGNRPNQTGLCVPCLAERRRTAPCGTETRYSSGCRCDECRAAGTAARRARRQADPERSRAYDRAYKARTRQVAA